MVVIWLMQLAETRKARRGRLSDRERDLGYERWLARGGGRRIDKPSTARYPFAYFVEFLTADLLLVSLRYL